MLYLWGSAACYHSGMERIKPLVLVILDGFGVSREAAGNPVAAAQKPVLDSFERRFPFMTLQASGVAVGLPWGEAGNSEVGHLTMGAGRVMYHHLPRIIHAIRDGSFFNNPALKAAAAHAREYHGRLHVAGLVSSGSVHSYAEHLEALLEFAEREKLGKVLIHVFTDGKDAPPKEGASFLRAFETRRAQDYPGARIATVMGRFFAMDRDGKWDRTERAYRLMTQGEGTAAASAPAYLESAYEKGVTDEFIEPAVVLREGDVAPVVRQGDALVFFNFREDSMREITRAFAEDGFDKFPREKIPDLYIATMTEYEKDMPGVSAAFVMPDVSHTLGAVLADAALRQLRIAESEKYAHVTYFFNGGQERPYAGEDRVLVPSLSVAHFDEAPEMQSREIAGRVVANLDAYDVLIANFANADMVGHSGDFQAAVRAVEAVDRALGELAAAVRNKNGVMLVTADHGNVELKRNPLSGERMTEHSLNPVPFFLVGEGFRRPSDRTDEAIADEKSRVNGILTDIAPTVLDLLGIPKPAEMTGASLLSKLLAQVQ